jgi:hypothetical protein
MSRFWIAGGYSSILTGSCAKDFEAKQAIGFSAQSNTTFAVVRFKLLYFAKH